MFRRAGRTGGLESLAWEREDASQKLPRLRGKRRCWKREATSFLLTREENEAF